MAILILLQELQMSGCIIERVFADTRLRQDILPMESRRAIREDAEAIREMQYRCH